MWLDHKHLNLGTFCAFHPHHLAWANIHLVFQLLVEEGELLFGLGTVLHAIECRRLACCGVSVVEIAVVAEAESGNGTVGQHFGVLTAFHVHLIDGHCAQFLHPEINALAVGSPKVIVVHPVVNILGQHSLLASSAVVERQAETVAFVARHHLEAVGDIAAVGRVFWCAVPSLVVGSDTFSLTTSHRHNEQIGVGVCLWVVGVVADKAKFLAVGREGEAWSIAPSGSRKFARSDIGIGLFCDIVNDDVAVAAIGIVGPMAVKEFVGNVTLHRALGFLLPASGVGLAVGTEVGINFGGESQEVSVGAKHCARNAKFEVGQLLRVACGNIASEHLWQFHLLAIFGDGGACGSVVNPLAICRPLCVAALAVNHWGKLWSFALGVESHQVDARVGLVIFQILSGDIERQSLAVGTQSQCAHTLGAIHILNGECALCRASL